MADRSYMRCPMCRAMGNQTAPEMMRDNVDFYCPLGHKAPHGQMMSMNPDMIKVETHFKPGDHDIKVEVWVNKEVAAIAKERLGQQFHPTVASLIRCCMAGEPVVIDGQQAEALRKLNVRNGADMVALAKQNVELASQNEDLVEQVNKWEKRIAEALTGGD